MSDAIRMTIDAAPVDMKIAGAQGPSLGGGGAWTDLTGTANHIPFDTTPTAVPTTLGTLSWDADGDCLEYAVTGGTISVGKETFDYYTNLSGVAMVDGDIVSIVGATGNRTAVDLTDATDATSSANVIGMVTHGAANNGTVRVTKVGSVHTLNTNGLTEGGTIYVDPSNPGKWTMIRPTSPNHVVSIGFVQVAHSTNGVVDVVPNHQCITAADIIDPQNVVTAERVASTITSATEKTTPIDADQLGITDSAASGALKRLTFANLWTWVKSKLDTALTIAGNKTWSGQQEATGQSATNGTSLMTRDISDLRYGSITVMRITSNKDITALSLTDISGTTVTLDANSEYEISGFLAVETTGGSPTNRVQFRIAYSGTTQTVQGVLANITTTGGMFPMVNGTLLTTGFADTNNVDRTFPVFAHIRTSTSGNFTLQAYRISGGTVNPKLLAGSVLIFRKIP